MTEVDDGRALGAREAARRLARVGFDIHDGPLQELAVLRSELSRVRDLLASARTVDDRAAAIAQLEDLQGFAGAVEGGLRELAGSIEGRSLGRRDLREVITGAVRLCAQLGDVEPDLHIDGDLDRLGEAERISIACFVQEALANARRHSGATQIGVAIEVGEHEARATVCDDGAGFSIDRELVRAGQRNSLGLLGMYERARLLGGECDLRSNRQTGTSVTLRIPLRREAAGRREAVA